eukprot:sb/3472453/
MLSKLLKPIQSGYSRMAQKRLCAYLIIQLSLEPDKIATSHSTHFNALIFVSTPIQSKVAIFVHLGWSGKFFWCFWDPIGVQCKWKTFVMYLDNIYGLPTFVGNEITPPLDCPGGRKHVGVIISLVQCEKKFLCPNYKTESSNFLNVPRKFSQLPLHTRIFRYFGH